MKLESSGLGDVLRWQYTGAFEMLLSPSVRRAFELCEESDAVRGRYGRTMIGQRCLLARPLVESGARFVLVDYGKEDAGLSQRGEKRGVGVDKRGVSSCNDEEVPPTTSSLLNTPCAS